MRSIFFILLCTSLFANAQQQKDSSRKLCVTPQGKTTGVIASAEIGTNGGRIASADGKLELIFPEGALEKNTSISIQPQTNTMPSGRGGGYRLEPSGKRF